MCVLNFCMNWMDYWLVSAKTTSLTAVLKLFDDDAMQLTINAYNITHTHTHSLRKREAIRQRGGDSNEDFSLGLKKEENIALFHSVTPMCRERMGREEGNGGVGLNGWDGMLEIPHIPLPSSPLLASKSSPQTSPRGSDRLPSSLRNRGQPRTRGSWYLPGMEYSDPKRRSHFLGKFLTVFILTALCVFMLKQSSCHKDVNVFSRHEVGITHILVTGGAGYIGSHAALRLLKESYRVTILDNLSRGNHGAVKVLQKQFPKPGRLQFICADLGDAKTLNRIFAENEFDAVMHFAGVAYVGESTLEPLRYYHNITSNTLIVLEAMAKHGVKTLIYSSTCATYGEPEKMPITEKTPQNPINPYGKAKKMAEDIILDFSKKSNIAVMILRYFNVIGSDPEGILGESPRPELREHGRISGACFDAASGIIPGLKVKGTDYETPDGTCVRDYIDVTDLVDAHVKALDKARPNKVGIYNVGMGKGRSVMEFVEACKKATGVDVKVEFLSRRPGDYAEVYSDPSKIYSELNWTAQYTDIEESLRTAWRWQRSHRNLHGGGTDYSSLS